MTTVLLVSNDPNVTMPLTQSLNGQGIQLVSTPDYEAMPQLLADQQLDVLVVDVTTHEQDMVLVCRHIRNIPAMTNKPLLLVTPALSANEAAHLLDAGADDVVRKPFSESILVARMHALLRWQKKPAHPREPQIRLSVEDGRVWVDAREVKLTPIEFQLLRFLCHNRQQYLTAQQIMESMWAEQVSDTALVRNHIRNVRRKLERDANYPEILVSRYRQGYKVLALVQES